MAEGMSVEEALADGYELVRGDRSGHTARAHRVVDNVRRKTGTTLSVATVEVWIRDQDEGRGSGAGVAEGTDDDELGLEDWVALRLTRLRSLGLRAESLAMLEGKGLKTVGDLQDQLAAGELDLPEVVQDDIEGALRRALRE